MIESFCPATSNHSVAGAGSASVELPYDGRSDFVDRQNLGGSADLGVPFFPLVSFIVPTYPADALPPELAEIPAEKPGSRKPA